MPIDSDDLKEIILFQLRRNIVVFYKRYLSILEDVSNDHAIFKDRVSDHVPKEFLNNVDYDTTGKVTSFMISASGSGYTQSNTNVISKRNPPKIKNMGVEKLNA